MLGLLVLKIVTDSLICSVCDMLSMAFAEKPLNSTGQEIVGIAFFTKHPVYA